MVNGQIDGWSAMNIPPTVSSITILQIQARRVQLKGIIQRLYEDIDRIAVHHKDRVLVSHTCRLQFITSWKYGLRPKSPTKCQALPEFQSHQLVGGNLGFSGVMWQTKPSRHQTFSYRRRSRCDYSCDN